MPSSERIDRMGEEALIVTLSTRFSNRVNDRVHTLAAKLRESSGEAIREIVPAYSSLLVTYEAESSAPEEVRASIVHALANYEPAKTAASPRLHELPVLYGSDEGPDLKAVAELADLSLADIIRLHTSRSYRVYFLGFMPGFGYMGPTAPPLEVPRLQRPRTRVPAGSVGLAGRQTGVYPLSGPGGWQLIGLCSTIMWDPHRREPALLAPGDQVRFVESAVPASPPYAQKEAHQPSNPLFEVLEPGAMTTVQDLGRPHVSQMGLSPGGAFDPSAAMRANGLVGNQPGAAVLEITWTGPVLRVLRPTIIAIMGADMGCVADDRTVPPGISWFVRAGTLIRFTRSGPSPGAARCYLAVHGGIDVPPILGSRSTYVPGAFGGLAGRPLRAGDILGGLPTELPAATFAGRRLHHESARESPVLRFVRYEGPGGVAPRVVRDFTCTTWQVSQQSDRIGTRFAPLDGPPMRGGRADLLSFGVVRGAIQLPPGGEPVLLNVDHQTTGGYPLIGVVAQVDLPLVAQLAPGQEIRFGEIALHEARELSRGACSQLDADLRR
jgi:KipI family sensor histidine kinase inhibitor